MGSSHRGGGAQEVTLRLYGRARSLSECLWTWRSRNIAALPGLLSLTPIIRPEWRGRQSFFVDQIRYRVACPGVAHRHRILHFGAAHHHAIAVDARFRRNEAAIRTCYHESSQTAVSRRKACAGMIEPRTQLAAFTRGLAEDRTGVFQILFVRDGPSCQRQPASHFLLV